MSDFEYNTISNGKVLLRPFLPADAADIHAAVQESGDELSLWMPDLNARMAVDDMRSWIDLTHNWLEEGTAYNFAVVDAKGGQFLGGCGLTQITRRHLFANLYYWVRSSRTGNGVATALVPLLARFGFDNVGLHRIEIVVAVGNDASVRVAEKAGAVYEGTLRNRIHMHGRVYDARLFSLIPADLAT